MKIENRKFERKYVPDRLFYDSINKILSVIGFATISLKEMKELIKEVRIKVELDVIKKEG